MYQQSLSTALSTWIIKKAREFQKNIYFCFIDYAKAFDCVDHNKLWKILKEMRYVAEHALFTWLITHLSRDITCTDHVALMH